MAAFDLEEQEQISQIKGWWEQFGTLVTGAAVAAALASVGWQGWQWYQGKQSAEASALYGVLQKAASEKNTQKAREAAGTLAAPAKLEDLDVFPPGAGQQVGLDVLGINLLLRDAVANHGDTGVRRQEGFSPQAGGNEKERKKREETHRGCSYRQKAGVLARICFLPSSDWGTGVGIRDEGLFEDADQFVLASA